MSDSFENDNDLPEKIFCKHYTYTIESTFVLTQGLARHQKRDHVVEAINNLLADPEAISAIKNDGVIR